MSFLYPSFLWALLLVLIPIIIHLFYFRRYKTVYFSSVKMLQELNQEQSTRNRLRNLLILLSRVLALCFLVFAFAIPFQRITDSEKSGASDVSIYIDNSYSMASKVDEIPLFDRVKVFAKEIIEAYDDEGEFQILTSELEGKHGWLLSNQDAEEEIEKLLISPRVNDLKYVTSNQQRTLEQGRHKNKHVYILSDFQKSTHDFDQLVLDSTISYFLVSPKSPQIENVAIDTAYLYSPVVSYQEENRLIVRTKNYGSKARGGIKLSLEFNGQKSIVSNFDLQAGDVRLDTVAIFINNLGVQKGVLSINDYPIVFDDNYYFTLHINENIDILQAYDKTRDEALFRAIKAGDQIKIKDTKLNQLDYGSMSDYQAIFLDGIESSSSGLNESLRQYVEQGGNLILIPSDRSTDIDDLCQSLRLPELNESSDKGQEIEQLNTRDFLFRNVYSRTSKNIGLPRFERVYHVQSNIGEVVLRFKDGSPLLIRQRIKEGLVYLFTASIDKKNSNITQLAEIFVPMIYKMMQDMNSRGSISCDLASNRIDIDKSLVGDIYEPTVEVVGENMSFVSSLEDRGQGYHMALSDQIEEAGFYKVLQNDSLITTIALNQDRHESNVVKYTEEELEKFGAAHDNVSILRPTSEQGLKGLVDQVQHGKKYWKHALALAVLFLLIEILLVKFLKPQKLKVS